MSSQISKHGLSKDNNAEYNDTINCLQEIIAVITNMQIGQRRYWKPIQTGILLAIKGALDLQEQFLTCNLLSKDNNKEKETKANLGSLSALDSNSDNTEAEEKESLFYLLGSIIKNIKTNQLHCNSCLEPVIAQTLKAVKELKVLSVGKPVTDNMRVCSLHFKSSDYIAQGNCNYILEIALSESASPKLKRCAVASLNLRKLPKQITEKTVERRIRLEKRNTLQKKVAVSPQRQNYEYRLDKIDIAVDKNNISFSDLTEEEQTAVQGLLNL
ncbi:hypothetical protein ILUMI_09034 [Ignelater luminosus]|uniref:THAP-type domain-containing protein n=1 Tax=Ignelater luminosus TaxID=2038154 RepID=A0A8K0DA35_IGNLU|nr:hypothetical protein ILUMI_09034 [Ignelater luminosus]